MHARVSTYHVNDCERFVEGLVTVVGDLHELEGFSHAYLLVDRECGEALSITVWESEDAMQQSLPIANKLRERGTRHDNADIVSIGEYEIIGTTPETITPSGDLVPAAVRR